MGMFYAQSEPGAPPFVGGRVRLERVVCADAGQFDLDFIERDVWARLPMKNVVNEAMARNGTSWDYRPDSDPSRQYVRA